MMSSVLDRVWAAGWCAGVIGAVLLSGCGRDRQGSGTEGGAVTDSASTAPAHTDSAAPAVDPTASARDTAANQQAQRPTPPAPSKPAPAKPPAASEPAAPAKTDPASGTTTTADAPLRDAYHQAPRDTVDQVTYQGWKQYNLNCARCHGEDVLGSTIAPHLIVSLKPDGPINTQEIFVQTVCAGRPAKGMPAWCSLGMDPEKINQIYSYVKGRSAGKIGPGRPAVKQEG